MKIKGTTVIIDGKYYVREIVRGKETLHPTQWTVKDTENAKAKLTLLVEGTRAIDAGEITFSEFAAQFLALPGGVE